MASVARIESADWEPRSSWHTVRFPLCHSKPTAAAAAAAEAAEAAEAAAL